MQDVASNDPLQESKERVDDVVLAVGAYSDMISIMYSAPRGHPIVPVVSSQWLAVLLIKLQEWGAITEAQHDQVMHRVKQMTVEREIAAKEEGEVDVEIGDDVRGLLEQLGI